MILSGLLVLCYSLPIMAEVTVYLDNVTNGTFEFRNNFNKSTDFNANFSMNVVGFQTIKDRVKFGAELGLGAVATASSKDLDLTSLGLTTGYRVTDKKHFKWDLNLSYQSFKLDSVELTGIQGGTDIVIGSEKSHFDLLVMLPFSGSINQPGYTNARLMESQVKYSYIFDNGIGLSIGYRYNPFNTSVNHLAGLDLTRYGGTVGLIYQF